jgi:hypothetical protein
MSILQIKALYSRSQELKAQCINNSTAENVAEYTALKAVLKAVCV